jgi:hypothetical protein
LQAQEKSPAKAPGPGEFNPAHETVELFKGIEDGKLEVRYIPRDEKQGRVLIANKGEQPVNVRLPDTFAAVPVLAQFFFGGPQQQQQNQPQQQQAQPVGGSIFQPGGGGQGAGRQGMPNFFQGGVMFNIPAEKQRDFRVNTLCLAHGKPNPRSAMPYKLVPLQQVTSDPLVASVLREYGQGKFSQASAQAAAWHLTDDLNWEKLAKLEGSMVAVGVYDRLFSKQEIEDAKKLLAAAEKNVQPQTPAAPVTSANVSSLGTKITVDQKLPKK